MKFVQHIPAGINVIRRYSSETITIAEETLRTSCIVGASTLIRDWPPRDVESLTVAHLETIWDLKPEVVVLATGAQQRFPRAALRAEFATRKIGLEVMEIGAACRTYNVLLSEERQVLAAVLLPASKGSE
jgi:uncharacterized protein